MKGDAPIISNVVLNGVLNHDLSPFESAETGKMKEIEQSSLTPVRGVVTLDGKPATGLQVIFTEIVAKPVPDPKNPGKFLAGYRGNARIEADGSYTVYANRGARGVKPGRYAVTFAPATSLVIDPKKATAENPVPEQYRTLSKTPFKVDVLKGEAQNFDFALTGQ